MSKCYLRQRTARETEVTHNKTGRSSECTSTRRATSHRMHPQKDEETVQHGEKMIHKFKD